MSMLCSWNVLHEQSRRIVSFILVCDELDKAGWVVLSAIKGIDRIGLELPLFDRTVGYCAWARMNSLGEHILSPE